MHASQARTHSSTPFFPSEQSLSKDVNHFPPLVHILAHGFLLPASMPVLTHHDQPHQSLSPLSSICCYGVLRSHDSMVSIVSHLSSVHYSISISSSFTPCHWLTFSYETLQTWTYSHPTLIKSPTCNGSFQSITSQAIP